MYRPYSDALCVDIKWINQFWERMYIFHKKLYQIGMNMQFTHKKYAKKCLCVRYIFFQKVYGHYNDAEINIVSFNRYIATEIDPIK